MDDFEDSNDFTGSAAEFLSLDSEAVPTPDVDVDEPDEPAATADAADEDSAEDDDLSPEERVAAVLAEDAEEDESEVADPEPASDEALSLDSLTPEQLRELAEEALRKREEAATTEVDAEQRAFEAEIAAYDQQTVGRVQQAFQTQVLDVSEAHYGNLRDKALEQLDAEAERQTELDPAEYKRRNRRAVMGPIDRAQRLYEQKKAAEWEAVVETEITAARKRHPGLRQRYAEFLAAEHGLPKRAIPELLEIENTDDMPRFAASLAKSVRAHVKQRNETKQQVREQAARAVIANPITTPTTTRPKSAKPVQLKGDAEEWLALTGKGKGQRDRALQRI